MDDNLPVMTLDKCCNVCQVFKPIEKFYKYSGKQARRKTCIDCFCSQVVTARKNKRSKEQKSTDLQAGLKARLDQILDDLKNLTIDENENDLKIEEMRKLRLLLLDGPVSAFNVDSFQFGTRSSQVETIIQSKLPMFLITRCGINNILNTPDIIMQRSLNQQFVFVKIPAEFGMNRQQLANLQTYLLSP